MTQKEEGARERLEGNTHKAVSSKNLPIGQEEDTCQTAVG